MIKRQQTTHSAYSRAGSPTSNATRQAQRRRTKYSYDSLGRTNQIQDPLGNPTVLAYDPATGWLTSITDPIGHTTRFAYYGTNEANSGKLKCQINAAGKKTYYSYTTRGEFYRTWGDVPYPAEYHYSEYGDLTNLITFRGGTDWTSSSWPSSTGTGDNTYRNFDEASGALLQKIDDQQHATTYTYRTDTGQLLTRSWARLATNGVSPVTVTNLYNSFGDLIEQDYNDGTPNVILSDYSRAGLPRTLIDGSGTNTLAYDQASRIVKTYCVCGALAGVTVSNHFDARYGRDSLSVLNGDSSILQHSFGYDDYGRLGTVSSGVYSAEYGYLPNSDLLQTTDCKNNGSTVLTTTRSWEFGMRLGAIVNQVGGNVVSSFGYHYDALNRRTESDLEDGSHWRYTYNDRDELIGAKRYWPDQMPVAGQLFAYDYDNIGNRKTAKSGGDLNGANLRETSYTANSLNQYTTITTPGYKDILGSALAYNSVTVNGGAADRKVEYFHREISIDNTTGPFWQDVTVNSGGCSSNGGFIVPKQQQTLTCDADGNLSFDGVWNYEWDGENRLRAMTLTNMAGLANSNRLRLEFGYDFQSRRCAKGVKTWDGSNFTNKISTLFAYDGRNLLAEFLTPSSALRTYMWGQDLSGTIADAGGVGGLLMVSLCGPPPTNGFVAFDGNGNLAALINAAGNGVAAHYEYSPFGEVLRSTGPMAALNPFRFSTKLQDVQTGLLYYGLRYYDSARGRWLSSDPTEQEGGNNLYAFAHNCPVTHYDDFGAADRDDSVVDRAGVDRVKATIRSCIRTMYSSGGPNAVTLWMFVMCKNNGPLDIAHGPLAGYTFHVRGVGILNDSEAGNYFAGYAGGYASIYGAPQNGAGVFLGGAFYGATDIFESTFGRGGKGFVSGVKDYFISLQMQKNGFLDGFSDAILGAEDDE